VSSILKHKNFIFYSILTLFIAANAALLWGEFYWFPALPVLVGVLLLALLRLDKFIILIAFLTPVSIPLEELDLGAALSLPSEPLIITAMMIFVGRTLITGNYDVRILRHPISIAIIISFVWMLFTSVTSSLPIVSIKSFISRFWFISTFYFLGIEIFRKKQNIEKFLWAHILGLLGIIITTTYIHSTWNFEKNPAHWVMNPFYNDHTAYGMIIAMFLPVLFGIAFNNRYNSSLKILVFIALIIYIVAFRLSNSRAAWVSLIGGIGVFFIYYLRIKWYTVAIVGVIGLFFFSTIQEQLLIRLERNKQDSSENLEEHIQSISNIKTDASNLERINRWNCAIAMFKDRPVLGFGPGTYKFEYAQFQKAKDKTIITTNAGNRGTAHSEYLLVLSEQGLPGLIILLSSIIAILHTGSVVYNSTAEHKSRQIALWLIVGFVTYWIHAFLNNFLETDKASVPYWAFAGILVALQLYHTPKEIGN